MSHEYIIIIIILASGFLGGVTNFLTINEFKSLKESRINFFKAIALGICASITVPLFLQIMSNNLLDIDKNYPLKNYLILSGFCVIAAFFSKRFLENLYDKVNQAQNDANAAKQSASETEKLVIDNLLGDDQEEGKEEVKEDILEKISVEHNISQTYLQNDTIVDNFDDDDFNILANFQKSKYKDRSFAGLSKGTRIGDNKLNLILQKFVLMGLIQPVRWYGKDFYRLTNKGKRVNLDN